ncbi:MAG: peptidylprolyl isomerase [Kineosporiaceae bacterium]
MSPNERERAYARKRYNDWQERQTKNAQKRRKQRNALLAGLAGVAVVALVVGIAIVVGRNDDTTTTASPSSSASPSAAACPAPTKTAPGKPQQWSKAPDPATAAGKTFTVTFETNCGAIVAQLDGAKAPKAVASTVFLARSGFYDGVTCHRLTTQGIFVLQCGDPLGTGIGGPGYTFGPVENAPKDNVYKAGTIAMARQGNNGNSNSSQFFLVYKDSPIPSDNAGGYTVMGTISEGLDVVQRIADGGVAGGGGDGAPSTTVGFNAVTVKAD